MPGLDGKELTEALKICKKKPRNFLFAAGSKLEDHYLDLSKKKIPKSKAKEAKSAAGSPKAYAGVVEYDKENGQLVFKTKLGFADKQTKALRMLVKKRAGLKSIEPVLHLVEDLEEMDFDDEAMGGAHGMTPSPGGPPEEEEEMLPGGGGAGTIEATSVWDDEAVNVPEGEYVPESLSGDREKIEKANYTVTNTEDLFDEESMNEVVGYEVPVKDQKKLNTAMEDLADNPDPAQVDALLKTIADQRPGMDLVEARRQYEVFRRIQEQAKLRAEANPDLEENPQIDEDLHPDFVGSTANLRFGKVVGEAFGIDPVFGAMLSPTGGMVGPGNHALHVDDDDPTGYHGIVHDAAGYLYNYHDEGPGYDYLDQEDRDTGNPLTGQQSGMRYWHEKLDPGEGTRHMLNGIDAVASGYDGVMAGVEGATDVYGEVKEGLGEMRDEAAEGLRNIGNEVKDAAGDIYDSGAEAVDRVGEGASKIADRAGQAADNIGQDLSNAGKDLRRETQEFIDDPSLGEAGDVIGRGLEAVGDVAGEGLDAAGDMAGEALGTAGDVARSGYDAAKRGVQATGEVLSETVDTVVDVASEGVEMVKETGAEVIEMGGEMLDAGVNVASAVGDSMVAAADSAGEAASDAYDYGSEKVGAAVDYFGSLWD